MAIKCHHVPPLIRRRFPSSGGSHLTQHLGDRINQNLPTQTHLSSDLPTASMDPVPPRNHSMRTRSMDAIYKPKTMMVTKYPLPTALQAALAPSEPTYYSQAVKSVDWRAAMALEYDALQLQGTWSLVRIKPGTNVVGCINSNNGPMVPLSLKVFINNPELIMVKRSVQL